jgi:hypothetical protein
MLSINHLAECHNNNNIIFCKTDFIKEEFDKIKNIDNNIILITGNSDYGITDRIVSLCPKNIIKWYAENAISNDPKIIPIPIGIENQFECKRSGHGISFTERYNKKYEIINNLLKNKKEKPAKFIYSNFNTYTNPIQRESLKKISIESTFINWSEPNLSYENLYEKIFDHKMVLCPAGNGLDTHRLWEVLYCNRIPITIKIGDYKLYQLYSKLPIIVLNDIKELSDQKYIENCYNNIKKQNYSNINDILTNKFWTNLIYKEQILNDF